MKHRSLFAFLLALVFVTAAAAGADESAPVLVATGSVDQAISELHGQITRTPNDARAYNLLCRAYFSVGDWDRGISACQRAVSLAPDNSQYHLWLGRVYGEKADRANFLTAASLAKHVREEFEESVRLNPSNIDARADLAEFYLEAPGIVGGGRDKALRQAESMESLDPARAHWVRGRLAEKERQDDRAEAEYKAAIEAGHGEASTWLNLGLFYSHRQRWDDMEKALLHVRSAPLDRPDALVDAAQILVRAKRNFLEAVELLRAYLNGKTQVEQAPAFKVHYLLGTVQEKLGDKRAAVDEYRASLDLARDFAPAQQALQRVNR